MVLMLLFLCTHKFGKHLDTLMDSPTLSLTAKSVKQDLELIKLISKQNVQTAVLKIHLLILVILILCLKQQWDL